MYHVNYTRHDRATKNSVLQVCKHNKSVMYVRER